jgi:predicted glycogen debranching enzyme
MISFDRQICNDLDAATSREWLETNGIGGFSCGTISGVNTRRYHGLLTAAVSPPLGRIRLLSKFDEAVEIGGRSYDLSANKYQGTGSPEGYLHLKGFRLDPYPIWTYEVAGLEIEKRLVMAHRSNTVGLSWKIKRSVTSEGLACDKAARRVRRLSFALP